MLIGVWGVLRLELLLISLTITDWAHHIGFVLALSSIIFCIALLYRKSISINDTDLLIYRTICFRSCITDRWNVVLTMLC